MNKDATIEQIIEVIDHPNAEKLDIVRVLGYQCVTQKGLYKAGDTIIYIRPDTTLPEGTWAEDYRKYAPKRVKTIKLRGEWSEGIIMPWSEFIKITDEKGLTPEVFLLEYGTDVSNVLDIKHYEPPYLKNNSNGGPTGAKGSLPYCIPRTDEERFENIVKRLPIGELVDVQLKIDGQSCSYYYHLGDDKFGVISRNLEIDPEVKNNYTDHIERYDIKDKLINYCKEHQVSLCIRGESYGQGIQDSKHNPHSKMEKGWAMFSVWNIDKEKWEEKGDLHYFMNSADHMDLPICPVIEEDIILTSELINYYSKEASKIYYECNTNQFEGVVVKHATGSFKIINKHYDSLK